ncbi:ABC transporter permease [Dictyobacter kobayashii]|uniref:ABC transporter permease n=2 Tax=Dictyobacter kobayashii TaxID=2014872 RepID=A0A402ATM3_9CHLR|nr:ABC transporter permease [Dictyobacter kobayashii]GCE22447.1 ABC transporter permease [Dictyobacter kobayashii]
MNEQNSAVNETSIDENMQANMARVRRRRLIINVLRVLVLVIIIGGWELGARTKIIDPFFWGQPSGIWAQIVTWAVNGTAQGPLWEQIAVTLEETVLGFLIGVILGVVFGILLGRNRFLADVLGPYIKAANAMPRVVLGSIFVIGLGLGIQSKVALAVVLVFFIVFFNAFQGVREVDRNLLANARILGANSRRLSTDVIIPSALTWIIASLHTSFSFALVGAVVGEFLGATQGIGLMIQTAQGTFNANGVFAAMVILAALALISEGLVTALENRLITWRPTSTINDISI